MFFKELFDCLCAVWTKANTRFRLRSTGEPVEIVHVIRDEEQVLCMVHSEKNGRVLVREQELELELIHVGTTIAMSVGLALSGALLGWVLHP